MSASIVAPMWLAWPVRSATGLVVRAVDGEAAVAEVAPQDRRHPELVRRARTPRTPPDDLPVRLVAAEVDRRADRDAAHVVRLLDLREHDLVVRVRVRQQLVVVDLEDERDLVRVLPRDDAERAVRRGDGVAAALDRELDDVGRVEVGRVLREARAGRVLDALVDGEDREVARPAESAVIVHAAGASGARDGLRSEAAQTRSTKSGPGRWRWSLEIFGFEKPRRSSASVAEEFFEARGSHFSHSGAQKGRRKRARGGKGNIR